MDINSTQTPAMPREINVVRGVTYHVEQIIEDIKSFDPDAEPTIKDVLDFIQDWIAEDFGDNNMVTITNENGEEL
jgi:hypothetical protein